MLNFLGYLILAVILVLSAVALSHTTTSDYDECWTPGVGPTLCEWPE